MAKSTSRSRSVVVIVAFCLLVGFLCYLAAFGVQIGDYLYPSALDEEYGFRRGLDLAGGSIVTFQANLDGVDLTGDELSNAMQTVETLMRSRLTALGYTEAQLSLSGSDRIRIEIPSVTNPEEAASLLGTTAKLTFRDSEGNVLLDGSAIDSASPAYGKVTENGADQYFVQLVIKEEFVDDWADITETVSKKENSSDRYIAIYLDEEMQSSPGVSERLSGSECVITGSFTAEEVKWLAHVISAGQLPFSLETIELRSVSATLGEKALESCLTAAAIGLVLVMIFMLLVYRLPGLISVMSLLAYTSVFILILYFPFGDFKFNLTLPGIAGVVLTIGMAVDANVIIFERIKEELRLGRSIKAAVNAGYDRAIVAILDSNVTTIIAAVVLWVFGTGTIVGFAQTLFIGIVLSMLTSVFLTKFLLKTFLHISYGNRWLYGE